MNPKALFVGFQKYYGVDTCLDDKVHFGESSFTCRATDQPCSLGLPNGDTCFFPFSRGFTWVLSFPIKVTRVQWICSKTEHEVSRIGIKGIRVISHMKGILVISHYIFWIFLRGTWKYFIYKMAHFIFLF